MDEVAELEDIVRQAVSEGDEATANAVMDRIEQLRAQGAPQAVSSGGPLSRGRPNRPAPPPEAPAERRARQQMESEAAQRAAMQAANLPVAAGRGIARAGIGGPGQLASAVIPGLDEKRFTDAYGDIEKRIFGPETEAQEFPTNVAEFGTQVLANPKAAGRTTIRAALKAGAALGALGGATAYDPEAHGPAFRAMNTAIGGSLGLLLSGAGAAIPGVNNLVKRMLQKPADPNVLADLKILAQDPQWKDLVFTAGQRSGNVGVQHVESQVAETMAQRFYAQQLQDFQARATQGLDMTTQGDVYRLGQRAREGLAKVQAENQRVASATFGKHLDEALELSRNAGEVLPVHMEATREWFSEAGKFAEADIEQLLPGKLPQYYRAVLEKWFINAPAVANDVVNDMVAAVGNPQFRTSLEDMIVLRRVASGMRSRLYSLGQSASPADQGLARKGKDLINAIDSDIKQFTEDRELIRQVGAPISRDLEKAWDRFQIANGEYKAFKTAQNDLRNTAMGLLLGEKGMVRNPGQALDIILKAAPEQQVQMINTLRRADPSLIGDIKQWKLKEAINAMRTQGQHSSGGNINPQAFVKALTDGDRIIGAHLWSPKEMGQIKSTLAAVRLINEKTASFNRGIDLPGAATAVTTGSKAFLTRPAWRLLVGTRLEKMLFDPESLKSLHILAATIGKPTQATARALGYLTALGAGNLVDEEGDELVFQPEEPRSAGP